MQQGRAAMTIRLARTGRSAVTGLFVASLLLGLTGISAGHAQVPPAHQAAGATDAPAHRGPPHHQLRRKSAGMARKAAITPLPAQARPGSPAAEEPAPVPNLAVDAPIDNTKQQQTEVEPSVFQLHYPPQGEGYVTGSSAQAMDDREAAKATGVEITVPLPQ
jgi:hypothetical protein